MRHGITFTLEVKKERLKDVTYYDQGSHSGRVRIYTEHLDPSSNSILLNTRRDRITSREGMNRQRLLKSQYKCINVKVSVLSTY